jgi:hypothetical protein
MSVLDIVAWLLSPLAGAALGLRMRSSALALLLGLVLMVTSGRLVGLLRRPLLEQRLPAG